MQDVPQERSDPDAEPSGAATPLVRFAGLVLDLDACTLARESGEAIPLTRGEFKLLRLFVSRRGRVLSRDALLDAIANRRFEPFDRSVDVLIGKLRRKIEPDPKAPRLIVTVPGEGYRFDGLAPALRGAPAGGAQVAAQVPADSEAADQTPEAAQSAEPAQPAAAPPPSPAPARAPKRSWRWPAIAAALALALFAAGATVWRSGLARRLIGTVAEDKLATAPRLSIVVLPFENAGGDKEQNYFADGITDDLTTDLSHLADAFVISRGTAFTYKGKPVDAKQIGRELGVRYLMEGSVRRLGDKVEVNARLVSTETGAQVWADRFDGERAKLGELQVDVVSRLANSLGVQLIKAEALRAMRERPSNPDAADLAMQAQVKRNLPDSKATRNEAVGLAQRALALDPQNVRALTVLAAALLDRVGDQWSDDPAGDLASAEKASDAAWALQPENSSVHYVKGYLYLAKQQWRPSITEFETATALDANNAKAYADASFDKVFLGRAEDGFAGVETALRLSPRDPQLPWWQFYMCVFHAQLAQWEQAIPWCSKSAAGQPEVFYPLAILAAADAWAGHDKEAKEVAAQLQKVYPAFTVQTWAGIHRHFSDDPTFKARFRLQLEGLRKAGVPEGVPEKEDALASAPRLSIVVMPFENAGGDKEQDYFADGITDDLTTDLSHLDGSFVISHGTALTFKDKPIDPNAIGHELGVRYLMEGGVRRLGDKVEVNARLVSTETGAQVWADRFDGERSKLDELQAEFVSRLANSLGVELVKAEALRAIRERPNDPDAIDLAMQGWAIINRPVTKATLDDAIAVFERALSVDRQNFRALNGLAWALAWRANSSWSADRESDVGRAENAINVALALEPNSSSAHRTKGWVFFAQRQMAPALAEAQTAIADDSNNADAQALAGLWKMFVGHSEDGLPDVETAFRLSPRDPQLPYWQFYMCHLHTHLAQWEKAIDWCSKSIAGGNAGMFPYVDLTAANAWAGHDQEARQAAARLQKAYPGFTVQTWASIHWSDDPTFNAQYARIVEGLRKAGLPEGEAKKE